MLNILGAHDNKITFACTKVIREIMETACHILNSSAFAGRVRLVSGQCVFSQWALSVSFALQMQTQDGTSKVNLS